MVCLTPFVPGRATQRSAGTPIVRLGTVAMADRVRMTLGREPRGVRVGGDPGEAAILVREDAAAKVPEPAPHELQMVRIVRPQRSRTEPEVVVEAG